MFHFCWRTRGLGKVLPHRVRKDATAPAGRTTPERCISAPYLRSQIRRTYSPPASGRWYCLRQSCALRGGCGPCGGLPGMAAVIPGAHGTGRCAALLHTPVKTCHRQLFAAYGGCWMKDGGNKNWQSIIWRQRLSAGERGVPLSRRRPT